MLRIAPNDGSIMAIHGCIIVIHGGHGCASRHDGSIMNIHGCASRVYTSRCAPSKRLEPKRLQTEVVYPNESVGSVGSLFHPDRVLLVHVPTQAGLSRPSGLCFTPKWSPSGPCFSPNGSLGSFLFYSLLNYIQHFTMLPAGF